MCEHILSEDSVSSKHSCRQAHRAVLLCSTSTEEYFSLCHPTLLEAGRARGAAQSSQRKNRREEEKLIKKTRKAKKVRKTNKRKYTN